MNRFTIRNTATEIESEASTCDVCTYASHVLPAFRRSPRAVGCTRSICVSPRLLCALPSAFFPAFRLIVAYNEPYTYRKIDKRPAARHNPRPRSVTKYKGKNSLQRCCRYYRCRIFMSRVLSLHSPLSHSFFN